MGLEGTGLMGVLNIVERCRGSVVEYIIMDITTLYLRHLDVLLKEKYRDVFYQWKAHTPCLKITLIVMT